MRTVIVTGSSRGIGKSIALALGREGYNVVVNYVGNKELAEEVVSEIRSAGSKSIAVKADVSIREEVIHLFEATVLEYGKIDVLINNGGIMITKLIKDATEEDYYRLFDINVKGTFFALQEAFTKLADNGIIINFSTSTVKLMLPGYGLYSASKAAVEQMTRVFAKEIGRGISVNVVSPGPTSTDLFLNGKSDEQVQRLAGLNAFNRIAEPQDIANLVVFLASEKSKWITGQVIAANGGMI
jgi:3-oxoacyl-[acyl-carrier protein] reductase